MLHSLRLWESACWPVSNQLDSLPLPPMQADACTLSVLLILQNLLIQAGRDTKHPVHVVAAARCSQTIEVSHCTAA